MFSRALTEGVLSFNEQLNEKYFVEIEDLTNSQIIE